MCASVHDGVCLERTLLGEGIVTFYATSIYFLANKMFKQM